MPDESEINGNQEDGVEEFTTGTLYSIAMEEIKGYIEVYLNLARQTNGLTDIKVNNVQSIEQKIVVLGGIGSSLNPYGVSAEDVVREWQRMRAIPFSTEEAITKGVYIRLRSRSEKLLDQLKQATEDFTKFDPAYIVTMILSL